MNEHPVRILMIMREMFHYNGDRNDMHLFIYLANEVSQREPHVFSRLVNNSGQIPFLLTWCIFDAPVSSSCYTMP